MYPKKPHKNQESSSYIRQIRSRLSELLICLLIRRPLAEIKNVGEIGTNRTNTPEFETFCDLR